MNLGYFNYPLPVNEPVLNYAPGSKERALLQQTLKELKAQQIDVPMYIGGEEVRTGNTVDIRPPHETAHLLGKFHKGNETHVKQAIDAALAAKEAWAEMSWENRANIFLKAADLLATKYRPFINGTTMLGQSKNAYQAEIDSACELIDFLRFNVHFLSEIYRQQPISSPGMHNRMEYRPLEGFVLAVTPFNFTAIGGNLPTSAAMCGNVVVWKSANTQAYSAQMLMRILKEAGLPDGVINLVFVDGPTIGKVCFSHREFAGVHFTGSTGVFNQMWKTIWRDARWSWNKLFWNRALATVPQTRAIQVTYLRTCLWDPSRVQEDAEVWRLDCLVVDKSAINLNHPIFLSRGKKGA
jgi:1-pyrroline-5-carboxylate dehydrogenase